MKNWHHHNTFSFFIFTKILAMIQRIQTVYLVLISVISISLFFLPIAGYLDDAYILTLLGVKTNLPINALNTPNVIPLLIINTLLLIFSLVTIFMFNNRMLQLRLCKSILLTNTVFIVILFFYADDISTVYFSKVNYKFGAVLPLISFVLLYLATRAIKKDESLVKSADRLR